MLFCSRLFASALVINYHVTHGKMTAEPVSVKLVQNLLHNGAYSPITYKHAQ